MLKKCFYIFVCLAAGLTWVSCGRRRTTTIPNIDYDITTVAPQIIAGIMGDFSASLKQWKSSKTLVEDADMEDTLNAPLTTNNYSVEYGKISVTPNFLAEQENVEIICDFSNTLQIRAPLSNYTFKGYFNIAKANSMPIEYKYTITVNEVKMSFTSESNMDNDDDIPTADISQINITYEPITINLEMSENNDYSAYEEINGISKRIQSSMIAVIREKLTSLPQDQDTLTRSKARQICMSPNQYIMQKYRTFSNEEQQRFYYFINDVHQEHCHCAELNIKVNSIKLKGLLDFASFTIKQTGSNSEPEFSLRIDNIEGETNWQYSINQEADIKLNTSNFTITTMFITGIMYLNYRQINIYLTSEILFDNASNDSLTLLNKILSNRLKTIIENKLKESINYQYVNNYY